jgi:hypothetical protein
MIENKLFAEAKEPALGAGSLEFKSPRPDQRFRLIAVQILTSQSHFVRGAIASVNRALPRSTQRLRPLPIAIVMIKCGHAPVAQLDRASGFEPEGREFESLRARHFFPAEDKYLDGFD